jgi:hypothetical protein
VTSRGFKIYVRTAICPLRNLRISRLGGVMVSVLAIGPNLMRVQTRPRLVRR